MRYVRAPGTKSVYRKHIESFLVSTSLLPDEFLELAARDPKGASARIVSFLSQMKEKGLSGAYILNHYCAIKAFLDYSDVVGLNWKKIRKVVPAARRHGDDRAPSLEEIRNMLKFSNPRYRAAILVMASGGIRIGAFDYLSMRDYAVIKEGTRVLAGKLVIYRGEPEEYSTFVTPEAVQAVEDCLDVRRREGEEVRADSPLIKGEWKWTRKKEAGPRRLSTKTMSKALEGILARAGLKEREFKMAHGFRKFFKTRAEQGMKSAYVEILMGHSLGVSDSYLKPTEDELLQEYLKAVPSLTVAETDELKKELARKEEDFERVRSDVQNTSFRLEGLASTLQLMQAEIQELRRRKGH